MYQNRLWLIFVVALLGATIWQSGRMAVKFNHYRHLNTEAIAKDVQWEVVKVHDERFLLKAYYTYEFKLVTYPGDTTFIEEPYWNEWAAQDKIRRLANSSFTVWFDQQDPMISSLQKKFPLKECISALIMSCLFLYFLGLGFYVKQKESQRFTKAAKKIN